MEDSRSRKHTYIVNNFFINIIYKYINILKGKKHTGEQELRAG